MPSARYLIQELKGLKNEISYNTNFEGCIVNKEIITCHIDKLLTELYKEYKIERAEIKKITSQKRKQKLERNKIREEKIKRDRLMNVFLAN